MYETTSLFMTALGFPAVCVSALGRDNNQPSPDEYLELRNNGEGIQTMMAILIEKR